MLNQDTPIDIEPETSAAYLSLNDHDYCSNEKRDGTSIKRENNLDNSCSSSSISSSSGSEKGGLIIAQELASRGVVQTPRNDSFVTKRRPGRPPKRELGSSLPNPPVQQRPKRPRQNVSVTDKSEWITGEQQIDSIINDDDEPLKRKRIMSRDSDHLYEEDLSSDYSAENEDDNSDEDEEDPNKLWCICRKPDDGKFMICCDVCTDWFHGDCVNVSLKQSTKFKKEGKEWFCQECEHKIANGIPRDAIPIKKEPKSSQTEKRKRRGRGRPKKSEGSAREIGTRSRNLRKSLDSKHGIDLKLRRNSSKPEIVDYRQTYDEFGDSQRLKEMIKERKKEFFYKRQLAEQQKAVKRNELGLGRKTLTANLSDSLDSLATSTNTPNMNNLPINIKSEHSKERHKPSIVIQINTKKEPGSDNTQKIVSSIVKSSKKMHSPDPFNPSLNDLFTAEPIQISKKHKHHTETQSTIGFDSTSSTAERKPNPTLSALSRLDRSSTESEHSRELVPKKKRKDSESSNGSNPVGSQLIKQKIKETLTSRSKQIKDINVPEDKIDKLAAEIESHLNECFKEGTTKYLNKYRSLVFNLRDPKNQCLAANVLTGDISPSRLVRMSSDEMASNELAKWRERENKHSIELIKRDAQLAAQQVIVKKTHKGELVIGGLSLDDSTSEVISQEPPTTPTKGPQDSYKIKTSPDGSQVKSATTTTIKILPEISDISSDAGASDIKSISIGEKQEASESNVIETSSLKEKTPGDEVKSDELDRKPTELVLQGQPKRFSVTIQSSLCPSDLSRLKEPLVKPLEQATTNETNDYNSMTPTEDQTKLALQDGLNDDEIDELEYDPEASIPGLDNVDEPAYEPEPGPPGLESNHQTSKMIECQNQTTTTAWSVTINMPDISKFKASAKIIDGDADFATDEVGRDLMICGRIDPDQMMKYIKKLRATTKNQILIIQLFPENPEDKTNFNDLFDYLYSRNRYGVVQTNTQILRDFYIIHLHERSGIPEVLKPIKSSSIDRRNNPNCLLGLLVKSKR